MTEFYWHIHHDVLMEAKPARDAYVKARDACDKAWVAYVKWNVSRRPTEFNRCTKCQYPLHIALGHAPFCPGCGKRWEWGEKP